MFVFFFFFEDSPWSHHHTQWIIQQTLEITRKHPIYASVPSVSLPVVKGGLFFASTVWRRGKTRPTLWCRGQNKHLDGGVVTDLGEQSSGFHNTGWMWLAWLLRKWNLKLRNIGKLDPFKAVSVRTKFKMFPLKCNDAGRTARVTLSVCEWATDWSGVQHLRHLWWWRSHLWVAAEGCRKVILPLKTPPLTSH